MEPRTASKEQRISVIVTTYGRPQKVKRALRSILAQTCPPLEIIIVDDGSRSHLGDEPITHTTTKVKYIEHLSNRGLAAARNTGALAARGELLAFIDDDDSWHPDKLERQQKCSDQHQDKVIYCGAKTINQTGVTIANNLPRFSGSIVSAIQQQKLTTIPSSLLIRRELYERISGFDEDLKNGIDHDFWFKLATYHIEAEAVPSCLVIQFEDDSPQITSQLDKRAQGLEKFLEKWSQQLVEWMGQAEAKRYCRHYRTKFLAHTNTVALLKSGEFNYRLNLLKLFIENPMEFAKEPRFLIAMILGSTGYKYVRQKLSK